MMSISCYDPCTQLHRTAYSTCTSSSMGNKEQEKLCLVPKGSLPAIKFSWGFTIYERNLAYIYIQTKLVHTSLFLFLFQNDCLRGRLPVSGYHPAVREKCTTIMYVAPIKKNILDIYAGTTSCLNATHFLYFPDEPCCTTEKCFGIYKYPRFSCVYNKRPLAGLLNRITEVELYSIMVMFPDSHLFLQCMFQGGDCNPEYSSSPSEIISYCVPNWFRAIYRLSGICKCTCGHPRKLHVDGRVIAGVFRPALSQGSQRITTKMENVGDIYIYRKYALFLSIRTQYSPTYAVLQ